MMSDREQKKKRKKEAEKKYLRGKRDPSKLAGTAAILP